jgi:signal transduction histidine kinase
VTVTPATRAKAGPSELALVCPQCRAPVSAYDKVCRACGVDLELAAAVLERAALTFAPAGQSDGESVEILVPRFGEYLVRSGTVSAAGLAAALEQQRALAQAGRTQTIGQVLLAMGAVTREQLDAASIRQVRELQAALDAANRELQQRVQDQGRALQAALQKVAELNALKASFVAAISHELRTPLATVIGFADLLVRGQLGEVPADQREAVHYILQGGLELRKLIEDLIHFAASMRGEMVMAWEEVALETLAAEALEVARPKAERAGLRLEAHGLAGLSTWRADREKLGWALGQLLDNALKFTPRGGAVTLSIVVQTPEASAPEAVLAVTDTGVGIAAEHLSEIFAPFFQVDGSATRRYDGTGLGLALVKRIAEAHGGRVDVASQPGQGSRFSIHLPASAPRQA